MIMHTRSNKKTILYLLIILLIFLFTLNGNKIFTINYDDIEAKNIEILEKENLNNYKLDAKEQANYNIVYAYRIDDSKEYIFIYSKSLLFNLYHLDDKFVSDEDDINTLASNIKYHNLVNINNTKNSAKIKISQRQNKDTISSIVYMTVILILIIFISYKIQLKNKKINKTA